MRGPEKTEIVQKQGGSKQQFLKKRISGQFFSKLDLLSHYSGQIGASEHPCVFEPLGSQFRIVQAGLSGPISSILSTFSYFITVCAGNADLQAGKILGWEAMVILVFSLVLREQLGP